MADCLEQRSTYGRISQVEEIFKSSIHKRDVATPIDDEQTVLHRPKNCLRPGFAACDLLIELLLAAKNTFQRQPDTLRLRATVDKERARPLTASYFPNELLYGSPRCDPFSPGGESDRREDKADRT